MKNRYEFNIKDISSVLISEQYGLKFTTIYLRKYDEYGNTTNSFIEKYKAKVLFNDDEETVEMMCGDCNMWTTFDKEDFMNEDFVFSCPHCNGETENIISEDELIDIIEETLTEDIFFDVKLEINNTLIL